MNPEAEAIHALRSSVLTADSRCISRTHLSAHGTTDASSNGTRDSLLRAVNVILTELKEIFLPEFTPSGSSSCHSSLLGDISSGAPPLFGQEPVKLEKTDSPVERDSALSIVLLTGTYQGTSFPITFIIKTLDEENYDRSSYEGVSVELNATKFIDQMIDQNLIEPEGLVEAIKDGRCLRIAYVSEQCWKEESVEAAANLKVKMEDAVRSWMPRMNACLESRSIIIPMASIEQPELFGIETPEYGFIGERSKHYGVNKYNKKFAIPNMPCYRDRGVIIDNAMIQAGLEGGMVLVGEYQGNDVTLPVVIDHPCVDPDVDPAYSYLMVSFLDIEQESFVPFRWGQNIKIQRFNEHRSFIYNQAKRRSEQDIEKRVRKISQNIESMTGKFVDYVPESPINQSLIEQLAGLGYAAEELFVDFNNSLDVTNGHDYTWQMALTLEILSMGTPPSSLGWSGLKELEAVLSSQYGIRIKKDIREVQYLLPAIEIMGVKRNYKTAFELFSQYHAHLIDISRNMKKQH